MPTFNSRCSVFSLAAAMILLGCGGGGGGGTTPPAISVSVSPSSAQSIDQGQTLSFTATVANDSSSAGVTWSNGGGGTLSKETTTTASYTAPSSPGKDSVTATSKADASKNASTSITISASPSITSTSLPGATVGAAYNQTVAASGGSGALTFAVASGSTLPTGLSLNASSGAITGTPTGTPGKVGFSIQVSDSSMAGPVTSTQPLSITVTALPSITTTTLPAAVIGQTYSQSIAVSGGAAPLSFSITGGSLPTGLSLNSSTGAITGTPSGATGTTSFTIKVSDANSASGSQPLSITVNPSALLTITTTSLLNPLVGENYNQTLQYSETSAVLPLTWSIQTGSLPGGLSLNTATGAITGKSSTTGTSTFTVEITDSSIPTPATATQQLTLDVTSITTCAGGSESRLNGRYLMPLAGFDASGPVSLIASIVANGTGGISSGVMDLNSVAGVQSGVSITTAGSSYCLGSDNKGYLTLVASGVTRTFRMAVGGITAGVAGTGRIVEFDTTGTNVVGTLMIQNTQAFSNSAVAGNYNFVLNAPLPKSAGYSVVGGVLAFDGTSTVGGVGDINTNGTIDSGNAGYPTSPMTFPASAYAIDASTGRGTFSITPPGAPAIDLVLYVIDTSELELMCVDAQSATNPAYSGFAGLQALANFTNASLKGATVAFLTGQTGVGVGNSSRVEAGILTFDGTSAFNFTADMNSGGTISAPTSAGTYTVSSNGRVLVTNTGSAAPNLILYLVNQNEGLSMSTDTYTMVGDVEPQVDPPFSDASLSGGSGAPYAFATIDPVVPSSALLEGAETYDGAGNETVSFELNQGGYLSLGNAFNGTYTVSSNGRVVRTWNGSTQKISYIVSPTRVITFGNSPADTSPTIFVSQQ